MNSSVVPNIARYPHPSACFSTRDREMYERSLKVQIPVEVRVEKKTLFLQNKTLVRFGFDRLLTDF